jgi:hypothetical protein
LEKREGFDFFFIHSSGIPARECRQRYPASCRRLARQTTVVVAVVLVPRILSPSPSRNPNSSPSPILPVFRRCRCYLLRLRRQASGQLYQFRLSRCHHQRYCCCCCCCCCCRCCYCRCRHCRYCGAAGNGCGG